MNELADKKGYLPKSMLSKFGCRHCVYRGTEMCPVKDGSYPENGICSERVDWLVSLLPSYDKKPLNAQVMLDLSKSLGHIMHMKEYRNIEEFDAAIAKLKEEGGGKQISAQIKNLEHNLAMSYNRWYLAWKHSSTLEQEEIKLKTPRKVDITQIKITPTDVAELIEKAKKKFVDADFEVEDEKD